MGQKLAVASLLMEYVYGYREFNFPSVKPSILQLEIRNLQLLLLHLNNSGLVKIQEVANRLSIGFRFFNKEYQQHA